jgi:hypothetical protein
MHEGLRVGLRISRREDMAVLARCTRNVSHRFGGRLRRSSRLAGEGGGWWYAAGKSTCKPWRLSLERRGDAPGQSPVSGASRPTNVARQCSPTSCTAGYELVRASSNHARGTCTFVGAYTSCDSV